MKTLKLTVAQALIKFLANQYVRRDDQEMPFFKGCFGIFGHGNVSGNWPGITAISRIPLLPNQE